MFEPNFTPLLSLFVLGFFLFFILFALALMIFWLWMFIDCLQRDFTSSDSNVKLLWIVVLLFAGFLGALLYFVLVKKNFLKPPFLSIGKNE